MAVNFKPHETTGKLASRWLTQSGKLSKAEQFLLDKWMTRTSVELRDTIVRECIRMEEIGVFKDMPDLRIIPQIETIVEAGHRKFLVWTEKLTKAIPDVVRSGFLSLSGLSPLIKSEEDSFADVVQDRKKDFYSSFRFCQETVGKNELNWKKPELQAAIILLATPDSKDSFDSFFPGLEEAVLFTLHHEIAHGCLLARLAFNPISVSINALTPTIDKADHDASLTWDRESWAALFSFHLPKDHPDHGHLEIFQIRWEEYYADVGGALMHARAGYSTQYIEPLCKARESGSMEHQTHPVLQRLVQILDFHPMVLNEKINAFGLHWAISEVIAPQIGHDILQMMQLSPALAEKMEQGLPDLVIKSQIESQGYEEMNEALEGKFPKMAMFFANLKDGPDAVQVAESVENGRYFQVCQKRRQQALDQGDPLLLTM